ncbi:penicillin-binding protein 1C [Elioraea rosea]|uniref:penicillin-binding protein 1C n=1 Tax=Elioraea rosea TaxID=2492390 RepID=UPI001183B807|nr:penicillin-binding protein 1C [Elioraea rosea]
MRRRFLAAAAGLAGVLVAAMAADRAFPPDLSRLETVSAELHDREGRLMAASPAPGGVWRLRTSVDDVPPLFVELLLAREDRRFRSHAGIDPAAIVRAAGQAVVNGRVVSGASTITMQVARLLEPRPRTLAAKLAEMARAVQLEARFGKDEILAMWLTLAPFGGNLEGVRAASLALFAKPPMALDPAELALLVALPQRPSALRPDRFPDPAGAARARVLRDAVAAGVLADTEARELGAAPLGAARHALPRHARHLASAAGEGVTATTLSLPLQAALERLADGIAEDLPDQANLAILVMENDTRALVAAYGGAAGERRAGALDLTRAVRSPGSSLKPALVAQALALGLVRPETRIADLPRRFADYAPENFDRGFAGDVTVAQALVRSLNLPAVALADAVRPVAFLSSLKAAGILARLPPGASPSLPVALGGLGLTLHDLAALYGAIATDGSVAQPVWRDGEAPIRRPFVGAAEAGAVRAMLAAAQPPPGIAPERAPRIAWKSGTSWGNRDAWAVGVSATHTVAVWLGRPDGTPMPGITGRVTAGPVLFSVFGLLPDAGPLPAAPPLAPAPALARLGAGTADRLRLVFPPPNAALGEGDVTLRASGGQRPLTWLIDGQPILSDRHRRETRWTPLGPGFYRVTVIDADGTAAATELRIR